MSGFVWQRTQLSERTQLGLPVVEVEREKRREVGRRADHPRGRGREEELLRVARKLAEVGAGLLGEDRLSLLLREEELLEALGPGGLDDVARRRRRRARRGGRGRGLSPRPGRVTGIARAAATRSAAAAALPRRVNAVEPPEGEGRRGERSRRRAS